MFNYNVINPVNIHYRKYPQNGGAINSDEEKKQQPLANENDDSRRFPNGNKVAIDYTKNQVNISQILQDFKSTIVAINTPDDIKEEVEVYLTFTGKESAKDNPSKEIILSNLKNAARITDKYIQESLNKPSRVVQDWVEALFLQQVNLKADPNEINEEFKVKIPDKKVYEPYKENYIAPNEENLTPLAEDTVQLGAAPVEIKPVETYTVDNSYIEVPQYIETPAVVEDITPITQEIPDIQSAPIQKETLAKEALVKAKEAFAGGSDMYTTLKLYDEALELLEGKPNSNLKSAIYFERGKVFDYCDYAELALIDYNKATKCEDNNLKTHAHIKMGNIYDDYAQVDPAITQYSKAISCSEEAKNLKGKTRALRYMASMFTKLYDAENMETFSELAMETARETNSPTTIAKTYLEAAENYKYIGEDSKALHVYGQLAQEEAVQDDYETLAKNYMEASALMDKKGNKKKSYALMLKSKEYSRLARLNKTDFEQN